VKPEQRLLTIHRCGPGLILALVHRGPSRVEHVRAYQGELEEAMARLRREEFYQELRAAWPSSVALLLGLEPIEPTMLLAECWVSVVKFAEETCSQLQHLLAADGEPDAESS